MGGARGLLGGPGNRSDERESGDEAVLPLTPLRHSRQEEEVHPCVVAGLEGQGPPKVIILKVPVAAVRNVQLS